MELLMLLLCCAVWLPVQGCEYLFSEEPVTVLPCNPYPSGQLRLDCRVTGELSSFSLQWRYTRTPVTGDTQVLSNSTDGVTVRHYQDTSGRSTQLILAIGGGAEVDRTGFYSCALELVNGVVLEESKRLQLLSHTSYTGYANCSTHHSSSEESDKCVLLHTETTSPSVENLDAVLYSVIGLIALFCLVIVLLSVLIVLLYRRKCARVDFKTADHRETQSNPYSGFTQDQDRITGYGDLSVDPTHLPRPHHITAHSPAQMRTAGTAESAEEYSRLVHSQQPTANGMPSGYSKLSMPSNTTSNRSRIYGDIDESDLGQEVTPTNHNSLESKGIFDDPEYYPLRGGVAPGTNPKYRGDYERDPNYIPQPPARLTSLTSSQQATDEESRFVISGEFGGAKELVMLRQDPPDHDQLSKYRGDYERCPNYVPPALKSLPGAGRKYSGNYERDPLYMTQLLRKAKRSQSADSAHSYENSDIKHTEQPGAESAMQRGTFMDV